MFGIIPDLGDWDTDKARILDSENDPDWKKTLSHLPPVLGAFLLGLVLGVVRERSQSIIPPIIFHIVAAGTALAAAHFAF